MTRYSIFVREACSDHDVELARVASNPQAIAKAAKAKMLNVRQMVDGRMRSFKIQKYVSVRVVDHG
jgi:hypothetical protein